MRRLRVGMGRSCDRSRGSSRSKGSVRVREVAVVVAVAVGWAVVHFGARGSRALRRVGLVERGRWLMLDWTGGIDEEDLQG